MRDGRISAASSISYNEGRYVKNLPVGHMEQDVGRIMVALEQAFEDLRHRSSKYLLDTRSVSITGQMHGVVCWDSTNPKIRSRLVTWEDKRCDREFLQELKTKTGYELHSGMGIATMSWLQRYDSKTFRKYDRSGTIMDYVGSCIVNLSDDAMPCMDYTNAASWGCFDMKKNEFDLNATSVLDLDHLLPNLRPSGSFLGTISEHWASRTGISMGSPVGVAMGDCACVVRGTIASPETEICVTFGTSSQIALIVPRSEGLSSLSSSSSSSQVEIRPYFENDFMLVGASLNAGNVLEEIARGFQRICVGLGCTPPDLEQTYKRLDRAARLMTGSTIRIDPRFNGERKGVCQGGGSIENITSEKSFDIGMIWYATCVGLLENLKNMLPKDILKTRKRVLCVGGAFESCATLARAAKEVFGFMRVEFVESSSKYLGALGAIRIGSEVLLSAVRNSNHNTTTTKMTKNGSNIHEKPSIKNSLLSLLPSRDSIGLSPKQRFEKRSEKRLAIYKKMYTKTRKRNVRAVYAPTGVIVEEIPTPHSLLSCQRKNKPQTVIPWAGVVSPLKETTTPWRRNLDRDHSEVVDDRLGTTDDLYNLDRALDAALLMERGIMNGKDPDL